MGVEGGGPGLEDGFDEGGGAEANGVACGSVPCRRPCVTPE